MSVVAMVELSWALDVSPPIEAPETVDDNAAMTRGVLVGLGVSVPLWLGFGWLATSLATALVTG
jgi:hypothetical protein